MIRSLLRYISSDEAPSYLPKVEDSTPLRGSNVDMASSCINSTLDCCYYYGWFSDPESASLCVVIVGDAKAVPAIPIAHEQSNEPS